MSQVGLKTRRLIYRISEALSQNTSNNGVTKYNWRKGIKYIKKKPSLKNNLKKDNQYKNEPKTGILKKKKFKWPAIILKGIPAHW